MVDENPLNVSSRQLERQRHLINMMGDLIVPTTEGFDHVNTDMAFTDFNQYDLNNVEMLSMKINLCLIGNFKQSSYLLRGQLATIENSRKSRNGRMISTFTDVSTKVEQTFRDASNQKTGFSFNPFGKKKD